MPILRLVSRMVWAGLCAAETPWQWLSMEIAAWWPCSTAQMMFLAPKAASPPKKTPGMVDCMVTSSTAASWGEENSRGRSRSIQGKAFSWPIARITSSQSMRTVPTVFEWTAPSSHSTWSNSMPTSRPSSTRKRRGAWLTTICTPSSSASSSSQGEALKYWRGRRAITRMSSPPRRREERQQSIAVLPTPMMSTRRPTLLTWPKAIDSSQSMPMWMWVSPTSSWRPGSSSSLPRGAPLPTNTASYPIWSSSRMLRISVP